MNHEHTHEELHKHHKEHYDDHAGIHSREMWEASTEIPSYMSQPLAFLQRYPTSPRSR